MDRRVDRQALLAQGATEEAERLLESARSMARSSSSFTMARRAAPEKALAWSAAAAPWPLVPSSVATTIVLFCASGLAVRRCPLASGPFSITVLASIFTVEPFSVKPVAVTFEITPSR